MLLRPLASLKTARLAAQSILCGPPLAWYRNLLTRFESTRVVEAAGIGCARFGVSGDFEVEVDDPPDRNGLLIQAGGSESDFARRACGLFVKPETETLHDQRLLNVAVAAEKDFHPDHTFNPVTPRRIGISRF